MPTADDHLVGYIRVGGGIEAIRADDPTFFDTTRNSRCIAMLVPLSTIEVEPWTLSADACHLPAVVREIVGANRMLITAAKESSPLFVLMYPRAGNLETSRGGVIVEKRGGSFAPLVATVEGVPYLVELKGCGRPLGGLGGYHLRRTSPKGCHFHVSGALGHGGAAAEFEGLEHRRASAQEVGYRLELRAVGYCRYWHPAARRGEPLGQVMRLCPSSLRASFQANPAFDRLMKPDDRTVSHNLGRESACLLQCHDPRIHRNPSLNNLCYVAPGTYVLSDIEAAPPLSVGYEALDFDDSVVPDQHRHRARSTAHFDAIVEGMRAAPGPIGDRLVGESPRDEPELGRLLYAGVVGPRVFLHRWHVAGSSRVSLARNYDHMRVFMPASFFRLPWREWLERELVPCFEQKLAISELYHRLAQGDGWADLSTRLALGPDHHDLGAADQVAREALLARLHAHRGHASSRIEHHCAIGAYVPDRLLETLYVGVPADLDAWRGDHASIQGVLALARTFLRTAESSPSPHLGPAGAVGSSSSPWSALDVLWPYYGFVGTYLRNEQRLLDGVAHGTASLSSRQRAVLHDSRQQLERLSDALHARPQSLHEWVLLGREPFVEHLQLPYMGAGRAREPAPTVRRPVRE